MIRGPWDTAVENLQPFWETFQVLSRCRNDQQFLEVDLKTRMQQTASWACWAPGLVAAVKQAIKMFVSEAPSLNRMSLSDWRQHARQNHVPYRRDCGLCVQEMGQDTPHRRKKMAGAGDSVYVMSVDVAGPFCRGWDPGLRMEARYALIATVPIPVGRRDPKGDLDPGGAQHPEPLDEIDRSGDAALHAGERGGGLGSGGALHSELHGGSLRSGENALHAEERGGGLHPGGALHPVHLEGDDRENGLGAGGAEAGCHETSPGDELLEDLREIEEVSGDPLADLGEDDGEDLKDLMEEVDDPGLSEGDVRVGTKLNAQWKKEMEAATKPFPIQNVTLMEVLSSRSTKDVIPALSRLLARFRALGIPTYRFHSDRARELLGRPVRDWVGLHNMVQTATCGDDPPSNGRVEAEVNQWKRRLRLTMRASGATPVEWASVGRHAMEERTRAQLQKVGLPMPPMIKYNAKVLVKTKVWQHRGTEGMASPYFTATLKGPSPTMSHGWLVKDQAGLYQHARTVVVTDPLSEQAILELETNPTRPSHRLHGKQSLAPKVPAPVLVEGGIVEAPVEREHDDGSEMYSPEMEEAAVPGVVVPGEGVELRTLRCSSTTV